MKIVVLDGYTLNPGDLSWDGMKMPGEVVVYDRTSQELLLERCLDADVINTDSLRRMKSSAFLINTARGPIVVEADLADALNSGVIAGAGIDVLSAEPPAADNPLFGARNCIITPHIAWATREARARLMEIAVSNLAAFAAGEPVNIVNK